MGFGIPYAKGLDDGSKVCPECGEVCRAVDESQETFEDAITRGSGRAYAEHYEAEHEKE